MSQVSVGEALDRRSSLFSISRPEIAATSQVDASDVPDQDEGPKRPVTPLENTYQLDPDKKFSESAVTAIIREVLEGQLEEEKYDARATRQMSKTLSTIITNRVKALEYTRYKIVTVVALGEAADQGVTVASRCLFDKDKDNFASASYRNSNLYAVATVYACYYE
ncbi:hypothetical protein PTSG_00416 [Salpingoeca rosetta]|uniref:Uncharacterized protein n=1 Tax=Salpingoeca rosetta (strain ATCC 50818 / BSB-021) TaxID=946362 RepID=F2TWF0_SALR5|nr:uncharacterized protein PTSG_00416 [Salpingoeca rosetta]EGD72396.1 hypothetical protein PTSG_00416 [Salpingoeca rosetta]|eukprot:XP_004998965.1 hypothetical protein PTSG_00416 [Salpingoeca rosetta]